MIDLKSPADLEKMRHSNRLVARVHERLKERIVPGVCTVELDQLAEEMIQQAGGRPAFKNYQGFPASICVSINEQVVHGIPNNRALKEGDILSLDIGVQLNGFFGDMAVTLPVGKVSDRAKRLLRDTRDALMAAIDQMREGNRLFDISKAIQEYGESRDYGIVKKFVGHGIGRSLHEPPQVPNYVCGGTNPRLCAGMVLAIEPMFNCGTGDVKVLDDQWTVVTADGELSAHFEHSVAITADGPEILTVLDE
jgi:methionyl aminopeptidase